MMISDSLLKKRGRPKKLLKEEPFMNSSYIEPIDEAPKKHGLLMQYDRAHTEFIQCKDTQSLLIMLKRISHSSQISQEFRSQPIIRLLVDSAEELMLNPFEVCVFSIYLERFGWKETTLNPHFLLIYVGLLAKKQMCRHINHLYEYFNKKIKDFKENFDSWSVKVNVFTDVSIVEINETLKKLTEEKFESTVNYNFYVDEILQISPPYMIEGKDQNKTGQIKVNDIQDKGSLLRRYSGKNEPSKINLKTLTSIANQEEIYEKIDFACNNFFIKTKTTAISMPTDPPKMKRNSLLLFLAYS